VSTPNGELANAPDLDITGVDRSFAAFETTDSGNRCDNLAATLAGELFRFMMIDKHVLLQSLVRACHSKSMPQM
jgi:hypothetical protein